MLCHIQFPKLLDQQHAIVQFLTHKPMNKKERNNNAINEAHGLPLYPPTDKSERSLKDSIPEHTKKIQPNQDVAIKEKEEIRTESASLREDPISKETKETEDLEIKNENIFDEAHRVMLPPPIENSETFSDNHSIGPRQRDNFKPDDLPLEGTEVNHNVFDDTTNWVPLSPPSESAVVRRDDGPSTKTNAKDTRPIHGLDPDKKEGISNNNHNMFDVADWVPLSPPRNSERLGSPTTLVPTDDVKAYFDLTTSKSDKGRALSIFDEAHTVMGPTITGSLEDRALVEQRNDTNESTYDRMDSEREHLSIFDASPSTSNIASAGDPTLAETASSTKKQDHLSLSKRGESMNIFEEAHGVFYDGESERANQGSMGKHTDLTIQQNEGSMSFIVEPHEVLHPINSENIGESHTLIRTDVESNNQLVPASSSFADTYHRSIANLTLV